MFIIFEYFFFVLKSKKRIFYFKNLKKKNKKHSIKKQEHFMRTPKLSLFVLQTLEPFLLYEFLILLKIIFKEIFNSKFYFPYELTIRKQFGFCDELVSFKRMIDQSSGSY